MKMEQRECSETSAYKIQMLGNYPEESTQNSATANTDCDLHMNVIDIILSKYIVDIPVNAMNHVK